MPAILSAVVLTQEETLKERRLKAFLFEIIARAIAQKIQPDIMNIYSSNTKGINHMKNINVLIIGLSLCLGLTTENRSMAGMRQMLWASKAKSFALASTLGALGYSRVYADSNSEYPKKAVAINMYTWLAGAIGNSYEELNGTTIKIVRDPSARYEKCLCIKGKHKKEYDQDNCNPNWYNKLINYGKQHVDPSSIQAILKEAETSNTLKLDNNITPEEIAEDFNKRFPQFYRKVASIKLKCQYDESNSIKCKKI